MGVDTLTVVIATVALLASGLAATHQLRLWRLQNSVPVLIDVFREFRRDPVIVEGRTWIAQQTLPAVSGGASEQDGADRGFAALPSAVWQLSHFYDNLGLLVIQGLIDPSVVNAWLGQPIERAWTILWPYIDAERKVRGSTRERAVYQEYFQWLAAWCSHQPQKRLYARIERDLKRWGEEIPPLS